MYFDENIADDNPYFFIEGFLVMAQNIPLLLPLLLLRLQRYTQT